GEATRQQLDPAGALASRTVWVVTALLAVLVGHAGALLTLDEMKDPLLAIVSLGCLTFAAVLVIVGTDTSTAPFTRNRHLAVHILMVIALAFSLLGQGEANA